MKDKEKTKPTKKKILTYYLILAACLLVIAAVTVGVVFAVKNNSVTPPSINGGGNTDNPDNPDKPDNPDNPDNPDKPGNPDDDKPTNSQYEFIVPVKDVNLTKAYVFGYDKTLDKYCHHEGMDFSCEAGSEVMAAVDGTVKSVATDDRLYGGVVTIEHANGIVTVYKFIDPNENLKEGTKVNRGDVIGKVAKATGSENADGDHLHFEVMKNNELTDPDEYLDIISK